MVKPSPFESVLIAASTGAALDTLKKITAAFCCRGAFFEAGAVFPRANCRLRLDHSKHDLRKHTRHIYLCSYMYTLFVCVSLCIIVSHCVSLCIIVYMYLFIIQRCSSLKYRTAWWEICDPFTLWSLGSWEQPATHPCTSRVVRSCRALESRCHWLQLSGNRIARGQIAKFHTFFETSIIYKQMFSTEGFSESLNHSKV